jgi:hypothetical protein
VRRDDAARRCETAGRLNPLTTSSLSIRRSRGGEHEPLELCYEFTQGCATAGQLGLGLVPLPLGVECAPLPRLRPASVIKQCYFDRS